MLKEIFVFALIWANSYMSADTDMRMFFMEPGMKCLNQVQVDGADLLALQQHKVPTKPNVKCYLNCIYSRVGMMNEKGIFDSNKTFEVLKTVKIGAIEDPEKKKQLFDICSKVNDEPVADGVRGCDRAALLYKCLTENMKALSDDDAIESFIQTTAICIKDHPVKIIQLDDLYNKLIISNNRDFKCLLACTFKKQGVLNAKGMFPLTKLYEVAEVMKEGDEKRLENGKKFADLCIKVNNELVGDGKAGCERAALMLQCIIKNSKSFGFIIDTQKFQKKS